MILRRLNRNSEPQASIESGAYTLQYVHISIFVVYLGTAGERVEGERVEGGRVDGGRSKFFCDDLFGAHKLRYSEDVGEEGVSRI